jgi:MFS family permease
MILVKNAVTSKSDDLPKHAALKFIIILGIVSLFADITYEGARSITGPFLAMLGASAATVGIVAGFGEFIGYALRFVSGYLTDKTGRYWLLTIVGYAVNVLAVPVLALASRWEFAVVFIILERAGKAIRTPARDVMLSHASNEIGRGKGFGLHQLFDQIGGMTGPLIISLILSWISKIFISKSSSTRTCFTTHRYKRISCFILDICICCRLRCIRLCRLPINRISL